jgi:septal ring factor EnvC (AmiA/AmiB activator)
LKRADFISEKDSAMRVKIIVCAGVPLAGLLLLCCIAGCSSTKPSPPPADNAALEQAKTSAQSSEAKLAELRQERMKLEAALAKKQEEMHKTENVRDSLKQKPALVATPDTINQHSVISHPAVSADTMNKQLPDTLGQKNAR